MAASLLAGLLCLGAAWPVLGADNVVTNCTVHSPRNSQKIYGAQRGLAAIALEIVDGGKLENVTVSGIRIDGPTVPIFLRLGNRARTFGDNSPQPDVGTFRNVVLRDITADNAAEIGCAITGLLGHPIKDVLLENIRISFDGGGTKELASRTIAEREASYPESTMFGPLPAYGFYCRHVEGIVFRNIELCTVQPDLRPALVCDDVKQVKIESLKADCAAGSAAMLRFAQVDGAEVRSCTAPPTADPFLLVEGDQTRKVVLQANDLGQARARVHFAAGASAQAVTSD